MVGRLGPNALELSLEEFRALLKGRRGAIKTFLLDQDRIAGIGNVYVQTPLWRAKIHPLRPIPSLSEDEIGALWQALSDVLQGSIDAGGGAVRAELVWAEGWLGRPLSVSLGRGCALSGMRDAPGKDPHGEHGELHLPGVPVA
jgi:formamidopyrimidine-DNA glycosylase